MTATKRMVPLILTALILASLAASDDLTIEHYRAAPNRIRCIDYKDGTLAIGTFESYLIVVHDGRAITLTPANGLPQGKEDSVPCVFLVGADTMYLAVPSHEDGGSWYHRFFKASLSDSSISATELGGAMAFESRWPAAALAPDGSLWAYDCDRGLFRYDGSSWQGFGRAPSSTNSWIDAKLSIAGSSEVFMVSKDWSHTANNLCRFDGQEWTLFDGMQGVGAVGFDQDSVWCTTTGPSAALYRSTGTEWELVSDDPAWAEDTYDVALLFDRWGTLWALGDESLMAWKEGAGSRIDSAFGIPFVNRNWENLPLFTCARQVDGSSMLIGTHAYGVLAFNGEDFQRFYVDSLPGNVAMARGTASDGAVWVADCGTMLLGRFMNGSWEQVYAPWAAWYGYYSFEASAMDIDGTLLLKGGAIRGGEVQPLDTSRWPITDRLPVIDRDGTKWFCYEYGEQVEPPVYSLSGETLMEYPTSYFGGGHPWTIVVGPDSVKFFASERGCTTFDGHQWRQHAKGRKFGQIASDLGLPYFEARAQEGEWGISCEEKHVMFTVLDAEGIRWGFIPDGIGHDQEGVFYGVSHTCWRKIATQDGLSSPEVASIMIDHNGDKWVTALDSTRWLFPERRSRLQRIVNGGPAEQKLALSLRINDDQSLSVIGEFINASYRVFPVLLWVGCDHDGKMMYYPNWGCSPVPQKRILCGRSIETEELLRLSAADLPPGDYTFYGAISLLGGMDCLIGARDKKFSVVTYHKD